ncbi:MAG: hypothetical protein CMK07_08025 [Ponticaulis sp.]|nr:hypothetical protein [Ponticaulis sp.]
MRIETREAQILDAAEAALSRYGQKRMTMDDVADVIGISRPAVYQYYKSKTDLIKAALTRLHGRNLHEIREHLESVEMSPPRILVAMKARTFFLYELEKGSGDENWFCDSPYAEVRELLTEMDDLFKGLVVKRLKLLGFDDADARLTSRMLTLLSEGIRRTASSRQEIDDLLEQGVRRLIRRTWSD